MTARAADFIGTIDGTWCTAGNWADHTTHEALTDWYPGDGVGGHTDTAYFLGATALQAMASNGGAPPVITGGVVIDLAYYTAYPAACPFASGAKTIGGTVTIYGAYTTISGPTFSAGTVFELYGATSFAGGGFTAATAHTWHLHGQHSIAQLPAAIQAIVLYDPAVTLDTPTAAASCRLQISVSYPTTATSKGEQLAEDQAAVDAEKGNIVTGTTILTKAGSYPTTATSQTAQLATDRVAVDAVKGHIRRPADGGPATVLGTVIGTLNSEQIGRTKAPISLPSPMML